jgi:hypothetical protein
VGLKLKATHQVLAYAANVNLLEDNMDTINKNTEPLMDARRLVKNKPILLLSRHRNADQHLGIKISNKSFQNVPQFKYLRTKVINQNQKYCSLPYSSEYLLSSRLLSKNIKIAMYKTIILPVVFYGCEACSLVLMQEHRLCLRIGCWIEVE